MTMIHSPSHISIRNAVRTSATDQAIIVVTRPQRFARNQTIPCTLALVFHELAVSLFGICLPMPRDRVLPPTTIINARC